MNKVRCNFCMSVFYEKFLLVHENADREQCPVCKCSEYLMDVSQIEFPQYYKDTPKDTPEE